MASGGALRYQIIFARSARKELEALSESLARRIIGRIEGLIGGPQPRGARKLTGSANLWRVHVGDYRILYSIDDSKRVVDIIAVRHRRDAYR